MKGARLEVMLRLVIFGAAGLFGAAIVMARMEPEPAAAIRVTSVDRPTTISLKIAGTAESGFNLLSSSTLQVEHRPLVQGQYLDHSSVSPWRDEQGNWQVVGCWTEWKGPKRDRILTGSGLMRLSYPSGEILNRLETGKVPNSPPAWVPGTSAQVVFAGLNGRLFVHDFDGAYAKSAPVQIGWEVPGLTEDQVQIKDVSWPDHPEFANRLLVSLSHFGLRANGTRYYSPTEIWWLELDSRHATAIAAGRVTPDIEDNWGRNELSPVVHIAPNGEHLLSFLSKRDSESTWKLHCTTMVLNASDGSFRPRSRFSRGLPLDTTVRPDPPVFREDGLMVTCPLVSGMGKKLEMVSKPLEEFKSQPRKRSRRALAAAISENQPQG